MTSIISIALVALLAAYIISQVPDDSENSTYGVVEIKNRKLVDSNNKEISKLIDDIQLLLSECPLSNKYILKLHNMTVEINNRFIYYKSFDVRLIYKLLGIWRTSREKAKNDLVNFQELDGKFKRLKNIVYKVK